MITSARPALSDTRRCSHRPPRTAARVLEVHDLTVAYGPKVAVDKVSFEIRRSEIFGLLGPNGAGKTTTLSAIEGLRRPRSGTVLLNGVDIVRQPALAKAQMGVQLQSTGFQSELTVRQVARLYAGLYGVAMSGQDLDAALTDVGLGRELDRTTKQISGGQQQRLSLFVALIHHPSILLLDEPTTGLDPQSRRYLWTRIERVRADGGSILLDNPLHGGGPGGLRPGGHRRPRTGAGDRHPSQPHRPAPRRSPRPGRGAR